LQRYREIEIPVPADVFKAEMRHFPAAVNIITCAHEGIARGLTATAVCSLCTDPIPSLLACVNHVNSTYRLLRKSRAFAVNVLSAEHREIAKLFASQRPEDRAERFRSVGWSSLISGAPILDGRSSHLQDDVCFLEAGRSRRQLILLARASAGLSLRCECDGSEGVPTACLCAMHLP
jgi:hypothetical protein